MSRSDKLEPGTYSVTMTITQQFDVEEDENCTENDALDWCRQGGECVDWDVKKQ